MSTSFEIRSAPVQKVLSVRETCTMRELAGAIGRAFGEVQGWSAQHGVRLAGPAFARYSNFRDGRLLLEAGFVVDGDVTTSDERVHAGQIGGERAAFALHTGPYDRLASIYAAMQQWIASQGYAPGDAMWEEYLDPPGGVASEHRTEIWWPLRNG